MNNVFTAKLLNNLQAKKKGNRGFTLIELLVVVIIIGVLAAVALPNLLGQVAKGRQSEAKNNLGAINRSQQAHRLEEGIFGVIQATSVTVAGPGPDTILGTADDVGAVDLLPIRITGDNYAYTDNLTVPTATDGGQSAAAVAAFQNDILDYSSAVGQTAGAQAFTSVICENDIVSGTGAGGTAPITPTRTTAGAPVCATATSPL
jgi:type IV pilus assembly protein PilA